MLTLTIEIISYQSIEPISIDGVDGAIRVKALGGGMMYFMRTFTIALCALNPLQSVLAVQEVLEVASNS